MPVIKSEMFKLSVTLAKKEPLIITDIKYSTAASIIYKLRLLLYLFLDINPTLPIGIIL